MLGLLLVLAGTYGVTIYFINWRRAELGIRLALGASPAKLRWMLLRENVTPVLLGLGIGIAGVSASRQFNGLLGQPVAKVKKGRLLTRAAQ